MHRVDDGLFQAFSEEMKNLGPFEDNPTMGVALSGGSDSLALVFLMHKWVKIHNGTLHAFHVDHGLRDNSASEALQVKAWMDERQIPCTILTWHHEMRPTSRLQEKARATRYALLDDACGRHHILHLVTAHHGDDQKETHAMRQASKSTDYGLAGMSAVTYFKHCRLLRPLLSFSKIALKTSMGDHPYLEDPSNKNPLFKRTHLREQNLTKIEVSSYREKRLAEEKATASFLALHGKIAPEGYGTLSLSALQNEEHKISKRALGCLIRSIGNLDYFPPPASIERLMGALDQKDFSAMSLGKCVVFVKEEALWVIQDTRALPPVSCLPTESNFWGRFYAKGPLPPQTHIKPLGAQGWATIKSEVRCPLPYRVVCTFPAYWKNEKVIAVPFLSLQKETGKYPSFLYQPKHSLLAEFFV